MKHTIDVVIPAYNAEQFIHEALCSVATQTLPASRVIVVDDGSTDKTRSEVERFANNSPPFRIEYRYQDNAGPAAARNLGLSIADAEFVALLDADDLWLPQKLEKQLSLFMQNPDVGVVYCDYGVVNEVGMRLENRGFRLDRRVRGRVHKHILRGNVVAGSASAVLIKRDCLQKVGFFDEKLVCGEDWDLWLRMSRHYHFDYVPDVLVLLRQHACNSQRNEFRMLGGELLFLDKLYRSGEMRMFHLWRLRRRLALGKIEASRLSGFSSCHPSVQKAVTGWRFSLSSLALRTYYRVRSLPRAVYRRVAPSR